MIQESKGLRSRGPIRIIAITITFLITLLGTSVAAYAVGEKLPQAPVQKSGTPLHPRGSVDNINIPPVQQTPNTLAQAVREAPYQQAVSPLERSPFPPVTPLSTTPPTMFWNLDTNNYDGSFSGVSNAGIYTNYYFAPNSSNTIYLDERVNGENSASQTYIVTLYDSSNGSAVYQNTLAVGSTTWTLTYPNLSSNHLYYVKWQAVGVNMLIDGTFTVRH